MCVCIKFWQDKNDLPPRTARGEIVHLTGFSCILSIVIWIYFLLEQDRKRLHILHCSDIERNSCDKREGERQWQTGRTGHMA